MLRILMLLILVCNLFAFEEKSIVDANKVVRAGIDEILESYQREKLVFPRDIFIITEGLNRDKSRLNPLVIQDYIENKVKELELFEFVGHNSITIGKLYKTSTGMVKLKYTFYDNLKLEANRVGATKAFIWNINELNGELYFSASIIDILTNKVIWKKLIKKEYIKDINYSQTMKDRLKKSIYNELKAYIDSNTTKTRERLTTFLENNLTLMQYELNKNLENNATTIKNDLNQSLYHTLTAYLDENITKTRDYLDKRLSKKIAVSIENNMTLVHSLLNKELKEYIDEKYQDIKLKSILNKYYLSIGLSVVNFSASGIDKQTNTLMNGINFGIFIQTEGNIYYGLEGEILATVVGDDSFDIITQNGLFVLGFNNIEKNNYGAKVGLEVVSSRNKQVSRSAAVFSPFYMFNIDKLHIETSAFAKFGNKDKKTYHKDRLETGFKLTFKYFFNIGR